MENLSNDTFGQPELALRVRVRMAEQGIRSVSELRRRLANVGVSISLQQLLRVVDNKSQLLSVPLLNGLMRVLHCPIDKIITTTQAA
jgi:hypothetical protein